MVHIQQRSVLAPAASRDQGRVGVQTLVGAVVSEGVEEAESEVGMLRYDISSLHLSTSQSPPHIGVN
jgi:hypothetical protein